MTSAITSCLRFALLIITSLFSKINPSFDLVHHFQMSIKFGINVSSMMREKKLCRKFCSCASVIIVYFYLFPKKNKKSAKKQNQSLKFLSLNMYFLMSVSNKPRLAVIGASRMAQNTYGTDLILIFEQKLYLVDFWYKI